MNTTSALLCLSVCLTWAPTLRATDRIYIAPWAVGLACLLAWSYTAGEITLQALAMVLTLCAAAAASQFASWRPVRNMAHILTVSLAFALGTRAVPGFVDHLLIDGVQVSPHAPATTISGHLDPGIAGLVLFGLYGNRATSWTGLASVLRAALPISLATAAIVLGVGVLVGYVEWDPKGFSSVTGLYLLKIAFWTLPLEEAFFRALIQRGTQQLLQARTRHATAISITIASLLFGVAHLHAGALLAVLAAFAGVGYGLAYVRSGSIEGAFLAHLSLNGLHFLLFTYPHTGS